MRVLSLRARLATSRALLIGVVADACRDERGPRSRGRGSGARACGGPYEALTRQLWTFQVEPWFVGLMIVPETFLLLIRNPGRTNIGTDGTGERRDEGADDCRDERR